MQIVLLNEFYGLYKTKQITSAGETIKNSNVITTNFLEDVAYKYGICISIYTNGYVQTISNNNNRGCVIGDTKSENSFTTSFIYSEKDEDTIIFYNNRFNNKTIVKAIRLNDNYFVFLNASVEPLDSSIILLKSQYLYIAIVVFAVSLVVGYFVSRKISKPIVKISNSAKKMANGEFNISFLEKSNIEEINELSRTLEHAKDELSKTDELRKDLMANVGHDLKTPLTMIKAYAEMIIDFDQTKEKRDENLKIIVEETDRLTILVNDILSLSKMQSNTEELKIEEFDLDDLIRKIIKRYDILVKNEEYKLVYENKGLLIIRADKKRIEQVIYNLLNNAINYTGDDKKVEIRIIKSKKKIRVEIIDTGKGIDKKDIKYIWDKYYHNEKKHKRNAYGTGLGLSIVKNVLENHKFNYGVQSEINKGTIFFFEIDSKSML